MPAAANNVMPRNNFHVAMIMDGNGRWATRAGLPRVAGHRAGAQAFNRVVESAPEFGISVLSAYAFSADNWRRPQVEVDALRWHCWRAATGIGTRAHAGQPDPHHDHRPARSASGVRSAGYCGIGTGYVPLRTPPPSHRGRLFLAGSDPARGARRAAYARVRRTIAAGRSADSYWRGATPQRFPVVGVALIPKLRSFCARCGRISDLRIFGRPLRSFIGGTGGLGGLSGCSAARLRSLSAGCASRFTASRCGTVFGSNECSVRIA